MGANRSSRRRPHQPSASKLPGLERGARKAERTAARSPPCWTHSVQAPNNFWPWTPRRVQDPSGPHVRSTTSQSAWRGARSTAWARTVPATLSRERRPQSSRSACRGRALPGVSPWRSDSSCRNPATPTRPRLLPYAPAAGDQSYPAATRLRQWISSDGRPQVGPDSDGRVSGAV